MKTINSVFKIRLRSAVPGILATSLLFSCNANNEAINNVKLVCFEKENPNPKPFGKESKIDFKEEVNSASSPESLIIMTTPGYLSEAHSMDDVARVFAEEQREHYKNIYFLKEQEHRNTSSDLASQVSKKIEELEAVRFDECYNKLIGNVEVLNIANSQGAQISFELIPFLTKLFLEAPIHTISINGCVKGGKILEIFQRIENSNVSQQINFSLGEFSLKYKGVSDLIPSYCKARIEKLIPQIQKSNNRLYFVASIMNNPYDYIDKHVQYPLSKINIKELVNRIGSWSGGFLMNMINMATDNVSEDLVKMDDFYRNEESDGLFTKDEQTLDQLFPSVIFKGYEHNEIYDNKDYMLKVVQEYIKMRER